MPQKTLGVVQLGWRCPNCRTLNPGDQKTCISCGNPQPEDVAFEALPQQELKTDAASLDKVNKGADIHCPYCGTRNPVDAKVCRQCNGDLTGGTQRKSGGVVGAFKTSPVEDITCPTCGTLNPANAPRCKSCGSDLTSIQTTGGTVPSGQNVKTTPKRSPWLWAGLAGLILLVLAGCAALVFFLTRTQQISGTVAGADWTRSVPVEALVNVTKHDWQDAIPVGAQVGACERQLYTTQDQPEGDYNEVCGTPYTVDSGTGYGKVVQDCQYEIYKPYCEYKAQEWQVVQTYQQTGQGFTPAWPNYTLATGQRIGTSTETYTVHFNTQKGLLDYTTSDISDFQRFQPASTWLLTVNSFGSVTDLQPR